MDSLKLPRANSATSSASGSNSNLSGSTSVSAATSPTSSTAAAGTLGSAAGGTATTKLPPGLSSSTPISVRFNANEESLDDILQSFHHNKHSPNSGGASGGGDASPTSNLLGMKNNGSVGAALGLNAGCMGMGNAHCDSLSSSPSQQQHQQQQHQQQQQQQHQQQQQQQQQAAAAAALFGNDEVNLRNNFLQGGSFFNRKRSGSIEGVSPTSGGPNLIAALTAAGITSGDNSAAASVGTWKLIKGKVTQTIEEIKSSKHPHQHHQATAAIPIIVADATPVPAVVWSNDPDSDNECLTVNTSISEELPLDSEHKQQHSDSDAEAELLQHDSSSLGSGDVTIERSRLRRGLAHIKSKVKAKQQAAAMSKKDVSPVPSASSSLRGHFLRRRNVGDEPSTSQQAEARPVQQTNSAPEIPIVSGKAKRGIMLARKDVEIESGVEVLEDMIPTAATETDTPLKPKESDDKDGGLADSEPRASLSLPLSSLMPTPNDSKDSLMYSTARDSKRSWSFTSLTSWSENRPAATAMAMPLLLMMCLMVVLVLPIPDFLRGIFATLLLIVLLDTSSSQIRWGFEHFILKTHPERTAFEIPNYNGMPICEIPAVEEHKTIKTYSGWLNEVNSYDPNTFSFSMTRTVYVRLDGSILKMSGTNARIPKRRMWNESPIDRAKILFTDHRSYDLKDCRIELLPVGLAKKRYFNRKYPIQLIIKNCVETTKEYATVSHAEGGSKPEGKETKTTAATPSSADDHEKPIDFGATVMQADLQQLRNSVNPDTELSDITVPCGDEVRLLLFSRCDREKEDWYRRFLAASKGQVHEQDLQVPMARFVEETDLQAAAARQAVQLIHANSSHKLRSKESNDERSAAAATEVSVASNNNEDNESNTPDTQFEEVLLEDCTPDIPKEDTFEGLIMSADVARNPADYIKFMTVYQKACNQSHIPVTRSPRTDVRTEGHRHRKARRAKRQEDELWKGIDQSLFLGPSGSIVWANVILGRCLFSCLHNAPLHEQIKDFMQKKLNSIKLPSFMEEVIITNIYLGQSPVLCHRVSQPMLDERGVWLDADITYEGLAHITVTTKLNLLRIRSKPKASPVCADSVPGQCTLLPDPPLDTRTISDDVTLDSKSNIYDSDAESSGGSSTDTESPPPGAPNENPAGTEFFQNSPGNARRIFKIVDRIAASNLFQYATELPYVQRAMENMNANITLRVDLKGLVARGTLNVPPPPSDRVWMSFRGPPRLWISTKPQVGDKSVDWSIVTNVIESKICEAVNKFLVYPNMVDFTIPFLSKPSYEDEPSATSN